MGRLLQVLGLQTEMPVPRASDFPGACLPCLLGLQVALLLPRFAFTLPSLTAILHAAPSATVGPWRRYSVQCTPLVRRSCCCIDPLDMSDTVLACCSCSACAGFPPCSAHS